MILLVFGTSLKIITRSEREINNGYFKDYNMYYYRIFLVMFQLNLVSKKYDMDIRNHGSGNAGATNVLRVVGADRNYNVFGDALKQFLQSLVRYLLYPADDMGTMLSLYLV